MNAFLPVFITLAVTLPIIGLGTWFYVRRTLPHHPSASGVRKTPSSKPVDDGKRQVPLWLPWSFLALLAVGLASLCIWNPGSIQIVLLIPVGLIVFFFEHLRIQNESVRMMLGMPVVVAAYSIYGVLFALAVFARKWSTFRIVCLVMLGVLLMNIAGCSSILKAYSNIH
jgi:hypothetical protein